MLILLAQSVVFEGPGAEDYAWFLGTLAGIGLWGLWVGTREYGDWRALLPGIDLQLPSKGAEDEALGCIRADPRANFSPEVEFLAGRAALRRLRRAN